MISKVSGSPLTSHGEDQRQTNSTLQGLPGSSEFSREQIGIVDEVHPDFATWVRAHTEEGKRIIGGEWINLNHSPAEIAEKFGTVKVGMRICCTVRGPGEGNTARAFIVGEEGDKADSPPVENDAERGLFLCFPPGIGV